MRYLAALVLCFSVVVVTGTLQMVVVVTGLVVVVTPVVVVSPGTVEVGSVVVGRDVVVVGLGVQVGRRFFTIVVVTGGRRTGLFGLGRRVLTTSVTVACQRTRVPALGDWRSTTTHLPSELPGPRVVKYSWTRFMTA